MVVIKGDITDYSSVLEAARGADVVIHSASLVDVWYKIPEAVVHAVNVTGEQVIQMERDGQETCLGDSVL